MAKSIPFAANVARARLRRRTHAVLRRQWGRPVSASEVHLSTGGRYVFRTACSSGTPALVKARRGRGSLQVERDALDLCAREGVPVPAVLDSIDSDPDIVVLTSVGDWDLSACGSDEDAWSAASRALRRLHRIPGSAFDEEVDAADWASRWSSLLTVESERARRRGLMDDPRIPGLVADAVQRLETMPTPRLSFVHGDCMPKHIRFDDDGSAWLIDFDSAGVGDPRLDLAVLTTFEPQMRATVLESYASDGLDDTDTDIIDAYVVCRLVRSLNWTTDHGYDPEPCVRGLRGIADRVAVRS